MAPPTPILYRGEAVALIPPEGKGECSLYSLVQYNCGFEGGLVTCIPFKRIFRDCTLQGGKHRVVEVTDLNTNKQDQRSGAGFDLVSFRAAQRVTSIDDV